MLPGVQQIKGVEVLEFRHRNRFADGRALERAVLRGELVRLRNGAFVPAATWTALRPDERRQLEVAAMAEMHATYIASHRSAAALWGVPLIRPHDGLVHARVTTAAGTRTEHRVRKHAVSDVDQHLTTRFGIVCTTLDRTVLDLAHAEPFGDGVAAIDWALRRGATKDGLLSVLDEWAPARGRRRVEEVIEFGDGDSGSAGESLSRAQCREGGLEIPVLQQAFFDGDGLIGFVDFWWPSCNRIGEFDGLQKYREAELRDGRSPGDVVSDEKVREDRLRDSGSKPGVTRWIWATLMQRGALVRRLLDAGVPRVSGRNATIRA